VADPIIATSETYESKESALKGIESVKNNAPLAQVDDERQKQGLEPPDTAMCLPTSTRRAARAENRRRRCWRSRTGQPDRR